MKVVCHTNLDLLNEKWPTELPARPMVGDTITSGRAVKHENFNCKLRLELEVCRVNFVPSSNGYYIEIELTVPKRFESMRKFYEYYANMNNCNVSRFI